MFGKHFCKALLLHFLNGNQCKFFQVSGQFFIRTCRMSGILYLKSLQWYWTTASDLSNSVLDALLYGGFLRANFENDVF